MYSLDNAYKATYNKFSFFYEDYVKYLFLLGSIVTMLISCSTHLATEIVPSKPPLQNDATNTRELLRADPRFIAWLEKNSLMQHIPTKLGIVSGTTLAWQSPSLYPEKKNILIASPTWFFINPSDIYTHNPKNRFNALLQQNIPQHLKKLGINGLYLSSSENNRNGRSHLPPESYDFSEQMDGTLVDHLGTKNHYSALLQSDILLAGNMLEPAMGIGSDFLLALRAVRSYPALFVMAELPKELWSTFSLSDIHSENSILSTRKITDEEHNILSKQSIIPPTFNRDFFPDSKYHGFALTDPIMGYDGINRRWLYRYAQNPYYPLFNFNDPALQTQRIFNANIIQQIGIQHQPLVGINIGDLWAQERTSMNTKMKSPNIYDKSLSEPALSTLRAWNRSIHGFGAWSIIRDAFPIEWMPILTEESSDFLADTIFMPALESSILEGNTETLNKSLNNAIYHAIDFKSLWHGSQDTYQKPFIETPFQFATSMSLALAVAKINTQESKILGKNPPFIETELPELFKRFSHAKDVQFLYLAFPALLPGLPFISGHDLRGTFSTDNGRLPKYTITHAPSYTNLSSVHGDILSQQAQTDSLIKKLIPIWEFRQKNIIATATIMSSIQSTKKEIFGFIMKNDQNNYILIILNCSATPITTSVHIPTKHIFQTANHAFNQTKNTIYKNNVRIKFKPWQIHAFLLTPS